MCTENTQTQRNTETQTHRHDTLLGFRMPPRPHDTQTTETQTHRHSDSMCTTHARAFRLLGSYRETETHRPKRDRERDRDVGSEDSWLLGS